VRFGYFRIVEEMFLRSWWVILFMILCYMFFEQSIKHRDIEYVKLYHQLVDLREARKIALADQQKLLMHINSQSDPAWIELTLMRVLGLVPEGQVKVYFQSEQTTDD
jgi:hypothetical protein